MATLRTNLNRIIRGSKVRLTSRAVAGMGTGEPPISIYSLGKDRIFMSRGQRRGYGGAMTLLHELAHATGHSSRLGRHDRAGLTQMAPEADFRFRKPILAREEIVAELTANRVAKRLGIPVSKRYAPKGGSLGTRDYIKSHGIGKKTFVYSPEEDYNYLRSTPEHRAAIVKDVREAENYLMSFVRPGKRTFRRGRPVRGGGA